MGLVGATVGPCRTQLVMECAQRCLQIFVLHKKSLLVRGERSHEA